MIPTRVLSLLCIILCAVQFSTANAQAPQCEVKHQPFANGGTSTGTMRLEQGSVCQFKFRFGQVNPPESWELIEPPKFGKVMFKDHRERIVNVVARLRLPAMYASREAVELGGLIS